MASLANLVYKMYGKEAVADLSEASLRCSAVWLAPGVTPKHYTRLERLIRDKH